MAATRDLWPFQRGSALRLAMVLLPPLSARAAALPLLALRGGSADAAQDLAVSATLYIGTAMSAFSGSISAGTKQMDLLGCIIVGLMTAIGGGTLRDVTLGLPPFWLVYPSFLYVCMCCSVLTFVAWPWLVGTGFKDTHLAFLWSDAIGMAASTVIGAHIGLQQTDLVVVGLLSGVATATFGGIGRDVLCLEPPRALYAERSMYATPAALGAACYVLLYRLRDRGKRAIPQWFVASVPFLLALLVRAAAWTYRLALPRWARKQGSFGLFHLGDSTDKGFKLAVGAPSSDKPR
jgi:uncharacterized membrane protein YeiH